MCVLIAMLRISSIESEKKGNEDIIRRTNDKMKTTCGVSKKKNRISTSRDGKEKSRTSSDNGKYLGNKKQTAAKN